MTINRKLKKENLVIIIPARLKSERLSEKLLRKINNVPMILRVAKSAINYKLGDVYVATDSKKIQKGVDKRAKGKLGSDKICIVHIILPKIIQS